MSEQDPREKPERKDSPAEDTSEEGTAPSGSAARRESGAEEREEEGIGATGKAPDAGGGSPPTGGQEDSAPVQDPDADQGERPQEEQTPAPARTATYYDDPYDESAYERREAESTALTEQAAPPPPPPPPPTDGGDGYDDEEEGMARMSFLEHLEELRTRIIRTLAGLTVAYLFCLLFAQHLFAWMRGPFDRAVETMQENPYVELIAITPIEQFHLLYLKLPLVAAIFVASPWLMYQAWAFIAPGLYRRERRWAKPFILCTAGLFILGGVFGYFVALKFALAFLLGLGQELDIRAMISINSYFNTFVSIMLGLGVVFQLPVLIFFLTLLRIFTPGYLLANVRYAILIIFVLAAVITPTPDVFNMILFAAPMILLFYVGIGASYLLVLRREQRGIPWRRIIAIAVALLALIVAGVLYYLQTELGYRFLLEPPFILRP